jgi:hypothetical protein
MLTSCPWTSRADIIGGKSPSNCTSTTAPITCVTLPSIPAEALAAAKPLERSKSGGNCTAARPDIPPTEGRNLSTQRNDVAFLARSCLDNRPAIREKRHIVGMQSYCMCRVGEIVRSYTWDELLWSFSTELFRNSNKLLRTNETNEWNEWIETLLKVLIIIFICVYMTTEMK